MSITVHRSSRPQMLVGALGDVLSSVPPDPFIPEVVAVPTRGIERWIAQELSQRFGITANVEFPTVAGLAERALAAAGALPPAEDPWSRANLRWWVAAAIEQCRGEPWIATVDRFVSSGGEDPRLVEAAMRIARLFHRYDTDRPAMVIAWADGHEVGPDGSQLPNDRLWQARLWSTVRSSTGVPSPAERLDGASAAIASGLVGLDLPNRVCVYGLTRISEGRLRVLHSLGETRDVHLFVLRSSPGRTVAGTGVSPGASALDRRTGDPAGGGHPLVSSWGRDSLELQILLNHHGIGPAVDHEAAEPPAETALKRLQADIRSDCPGPAATIADGDHSIQVHSCHGPTRQVEVLRDALLHIMTDDPTIQPRDVVIMCPDVETYAPLAEAVFGSATAGSGALPDLRLRVADRSPRATNPLLMVMERLLDLATGRIGAGELLDFAALEPVGRALGIGEGEITGITELVTEAGVRWGLDAEHRADAWGIPPFDDHTWRFGLDRLLSGVFVPDGRTHLMGQALPMPGIEGSTLTEVGRLAELVERVASVARSLAAPRPPDRWRAGLIEAVAMLAATEWGEEWQWDHLAHTLEESLAGSPDRAVSLHDARTALTGIGEGRAGRSNHRSGQLTLCTMVPMRSVPHRVVALLGIDDEAFPRNPGRDGDDLLQGSGSIGDRDPASEDRQLLLDAVLAAGDHLVIIYSGHDERTNAVRPPAVPVAELLDVIDRGFVGADGRPGRDLVVRHHPLQGFDPRNFGTDGLPPWGFDPRSLEGAMALAGSGEPATPPFLEVPLDWERPSKVGLDEFARFLEEPVKGFITVRVGFRLPEAETRGEDLIPVQLDGLEAWSVGDRLLRGRLAGDDPDAQWTAERRRGSLPPGALATGAMSGIEARVAALFGAATAAGVSGPGESVGVDLALPGGGRLSGTVSGVHGQRIGIVRYSRIKSRHVIGAFVRVVSLTLGEPGIPWDAVVIGRGEGDTTTRMRVGPLGSGAGERRDAAAAALEMLDDLWDRGMRQPLPVYPETTGALARAERDPWKKARLSWVSGYEYPREDRDPYNMLVLGGVAPIDALWAEKPRRDERGPGWPAAGSRIEAYARRLWDPVLAVLEELPG